MDAKRAWAMDVGLAAVRRQMLAGDDSVLTAVEVARRIELAARRDYVRRVADARAAGHDWDEIAAVAPGFVAAYGPEAGDAAFQDIAAPSGRAGQGYVAWRCGECNGLVLDGGPAAGGHPDDAEPGHGVGCERRTADVARYLARLEAFDIEAEEVGSAPVVRPDRGFGRGRGLEPW